MPNYRYVGSAKAVIMDTPYEFAKYGQLVDLPDEMVQKAIVERGIPLIPAAEFDLLGHDPKELQYHGRFETHETTHPKYPDFHFKKQHGWAKAAEHRATMVKAFQDQRAAQAPVDPTEGSNG